MTSKNLNKITMPPGAVPLGATHFFLNPSKVGHSTDPWRKQIDCEWWAYVGGEWRQSSGSKAHHFVAIQDVVTTIDKNTPTNWDGASIPSIGHLVEFDTGGGKWVEVTVFAVKLIPDETVDVLFDHQDGWGVLQLGSDRMRRARNSEEKAKDRAAEKWLEAMGQLYGKDVFSELEAILLKAGYRKT